MNAFKKQDLNSYKPFGLERSVVTFKPTEVTDGQSVINTIERVEMSVEDYSKTLVLPTSEEYSLAKILASGSTPGEVTTRGLIHVDNLPSEEAIGSLIEKLTDFEKTSTSVSATEVKTTSSASAE